MKNYFEFKDDKSSKFWEISINDKTMTTRYGKIGTNGQSSEKPFETDVLAKKEYNKLIAEKTKKGYVEISLNSKIINKINPLNYILQNPELGQKFIFLPELIEKLQKDLGYPIPKFLIDFWSKIGGYQYFNPNLKETDTTGIIAITVNLILDSTSKNIYRLHDYLEMSMPNTEILGENFTKEKDYLNNCFWIYCCFQDFEDSKQYLEYFYIDALGNTNSFRAENAIESDFKSFINKLVAMKPLFKTFLEQFFKNKSNTESKEKEQELELAQEAEKEANRKLETKESYLKKYGFQTKTYQEALDLLDVSKLFDTFDDNDFDEDDQENDDFLIDDEYLDQYVIYYAENDVFVDDDFEIPEVSSYSNWNIIIVVNGNLTIRGKFSFQYYVTKNATFDYLIMNNFQKPLDQEKVIYLQEQNGEDDEMVRSSIARKVTAPYFFSWFYDLESYDFSPKTVIIALYDWDDLKKYKTTNIIFKFHDAAFALKKELSYLPDDAGYNATYWNTTEIYKTLKKGQNIFKDGFDISCMSYFTKGWNYLTDEEYEAAFINLKKVTELSPNFYLGWYYCAFILNTNKAFEQAIPYFEKAIALSINNKTYDYLQATQGIAFALIRSKKYTESLPFLNNCIKQEYKLDMSFRYRGEALVMLKKSNEALQDLNTASQEHNNNYLPVLWLTGLAYYQLGKTAESDAFLEKAKGDFANAPSYETTQLLDFYSKENIFLDWENKKTSEININDKPQEHWDKKLKKDLNFDNIPAEFITEDMVKWFFDSSATHYINWNTFKCLPEKFKTKEIALMACCGRQNYPSFEDIPTEFIDKSFCLLAKNLDLQFVPDSVLDYEVCLDAVAKSCQNYKFVPKEFKDEKMAIAAIAGGALREYSDVNLPKKYQESDYTSHAIALNFNALREIPSKYIDNDVYEIAKNKYQNHQDWELIVKEFTFNGEYDYNTFEKVWACFWTEDFIIAAIKADERLYHILQKYITQKIAENAKSDISNIPKEFLTPEICLRAVNYEYATAFQYIPIEMRDEKVSAMAVSKDKDNFKLVPFEQKSVALSRKAILDNFENYVYIPYKNHVELYTYLLKNNTNVFYIESMYLDRGLGYFFEENYTKAIEDFQLSRSKKEEESTSIVPESLYYEGFANFKLGNIEKASQLFNEAIAIFKKDFLDEILDTPYETAKLPTKQDVIQVFSAEQFGYMMQDIAKLSQGGFANEALQEIAQAEKKLTESGCNDMNYWAMVWDQKRFSLFADNQKEACYELCKSAIEKLSKVNTWAYIAFDNNIRHALRSMNNTLAYHIFETAKNYEDIKLGLEHNKKSFIKSPIEEEEVLDWFYETKAELLSKAVESDPSQQTNLEKTIKKIIKLKLKRKGILSEKFIDKYKI